ncbi:hypothetical protein ACP70R_003598 [Stipagrostis hirtigluma subsp. patula]
MEESTGGARILSRRLVRPESVSLLDRVPSEPEVMHLTPWDLSLITVDYIQKGILLPKPPTDGEHVVDDLASSFARALGRFYPLAGRLTASEVSDDVSGSRLISLCCNGEGAEFVHAVAPGVTMNDITTPLYIPPVVWSFFPLNGLLSVDAVVDSLPVLAAQVTELEDGIFIAMSLNHGVADGTTFWNFFNTWSKISRSGGGGSKDYKLSAPPLVPNGCFVDTCTVPIPLPICKLEEIIKRPEYLPVQECFFHFPAESVKKLKVKANAEMAGTATVTISSLLSLLAHLWRAVCRARGLTPHQEVTYGVLVGCRARVKGIPQDYMGNAVTIAVAKSVSGDVLDKGLGWAAWLLNCAVASFDEAKVRDDLASWPQNPSFLYVTSSTDTAKITTGSSPRFDVYGNDFGWGPPVTVRSGAGNKFNGKVTVYEGRGGGGSMALEVCLSPEALARLVVDEEFMAAMSAA